MTTPSESLMAITLPPSSVTFSNVSSLFTIGDAGPEALLDNTFDRAVDLLVSTGSAQSSVHKPGPTVLEHVPVDQQKYPRQ